MIRDIAGHQNHTVKLARKLQQKKHRRERGLLVSEGMDLLLAALGGGADVREILIRRELVHELPAGLREQAAVSRDSIQNEGPPTERDGRVRGKDAGSVRSGATGATEDEASCRPVRTRRPQLHSESSLTAQAGAGPANGGDTGVGDTLNIGICDQETLEYTSSLGGSADVIFICVQPQGHLADIDLSHELVFFLDSVGDPGNVGTLIRSAVAFGLGGVICSPGTADPYSPKALRGGMGAQFSLPVVTEVEATDLQARIGSLTARGQAVPRVLIADSNGGRDVREVTGAGGLVLVLGGERSGPVAQWKQAERVTIPQRRFDSLNVAMAGTVLAYELGRARP
jgi:TrmH family RNA methyltransferase